MGWGLSIAEFFGQGGFFKCGRPHFLMQKTSDFSKFMVCPHGQGQLSQLGHFSGKEEEVNFSRFFAEDGQPLT